MAFSAEPDDPARSRLLTLGRGAPTAGSTSSPTSSRAPARPAAAPKRAERVGWPPAAPGTPATRLRLPRTPELPDDDVSGRDSSSSRGGRGREDHDWKDEAWEDEPWDEGRDDEDADLRDDDPRRGGRRRERGTDQPSAWSDSSWSERLAERWLPVSWREARWDPGRTGALVLALVAALAATVAAVGVWSDRPAAEPMAGLPVVEATTGGGSPSSGRPMAAGAAAAPAPGTPLVVSVAGKVVRPGLVRLPDGSRVGDAVDAAGGALPATDLTGLNLAARLTDGDQVLVGVDPPAGVAAGSGGSAGSGGVSAGAGASSVTGSGAAGSGAAGSGAAGAGAAGAPGGPVNLNAATLEQLDALPGVGPVTAKKILDWRTQNGRFAAVEQLQEVNGIGDARFATLRDLVTV